MIFENNATILFQGDSITEAGRNHQNDKSLGQGYAMMTAAFLNARYPEYAFTFFNRGVGGDTTTLLRCRFKQDIQDINPSWLSLLIGVNDVGTEVHDGHYVSEDQFQDNCRSMLQDASEQLNCGFILMEPYMFPNAQYYEQKRPRLNPKIEIIRKLAREFNAYFIPLDAIFAEAQTRAQAEYWSPDGVHLTAAGHALIAQSWIDIVAGGKNMTPAC